VCLAAETEASEEMPGLQYELDLGLAAMASAGPDAYARFRTGEVSRLVVSQHDLWKLLQLRSEGKGPDWTLQDPGVYAYADRFLYAAIPAGNSDDAGVRAALAGEFLQTLLEDGMQRRLANYGAFPVTQVWAYAGGSETAVMEACIRQGRLIAPGCFSRYWNADFQEILQEFTEASISQDEAVRRLLLAGLDMRM